MDPYLLPTSLSKKTVTNLPERFRAKLGMGAGREAAHRPACSVGASMRPRGKCRTAGTNIPSGCDITDPQLMTGGSLLGIS